MWTDIIIQQERTGLCVQQLALSFALSCGLRLTFPPPAPLLPLGNRMLEAIRLEEELAMQEPGIIGTVVLKGVLHITSEWLGTWSSADKTLECLCPYQGLKVNQLHQKPKLEGLIAKCAYILGEPVKNRS